LRDVIYDPEVAHLDVESLPEDFQDLGAGIEFFAESINEVRTFSHSLSHGDLSVEPPDSGNELASDLKSLHAALKHLAWQANRVAEGDYSQKVDFMGEFAVSFNQMVTQLRERDHSISTEMEVVKQKTRDLERSNSLFKVITGNMSEWIVMIDRQTGEHLFANHPIRNSLMSDLFEQQLYEILLEYAQSIDEESAGTLEEFPLISDTALQYFSVMLYPLRWYEHDAVAAVLTDVTREKEMYQELENVAYRDMLTGTYNRHYGMKILNNWIESHCSFVICFIDMDKLKYVNDVFGHQEGDNYILSVSSILEKLKSDSIVCRLGGDEYMVLAKDLNISDAETRLEDLRTELVNNDYVSDDGSVSYKRSFSYGVVEVTADNRIPSSDLLSEADEKMYAYKKAHKQERKD
jgi:diguanylate cyclase (GGDEF)-like protein